MKKILQLISIAFLTIITSCSDSGNSGNGSGPDSEIYYPPFGSDEWETVTPETLGWNTAAIPDLITFLETSGTRAFLVLKNGKIVMEEYFNTDLGGSNPFTVDSQWYWASAGKTLTSVLIGKAQEEGYLDINETSSNYLGHGWSSLSEIEEDAVTILHHITMTTGLDDGVANSDSTLPADLIFKSDPGTRWAYHNAPYTILDQVIEGATGYSFSDYFNEKIRDPLGMNGSWVWVGDNHVFFSTARSMARYGIFVLSEGTWDGMPVFCDQDYLNNMKETSQNINLSYGYLWWLNGKTSYMLPGFQLVFSGSITPAAPEDMFAAIGKDGQILSIVPSSGLIVIRMGENGGGYLVPTGFVNDMWDQLSNVISSD